MNDIKSKRLQISELNYNDAISIGKEITGDMTWKAAAVGIDKALSHYKKTSEIQPDIYAQLLKFKELDESIVNNIDAIRALAKNAKKSDEEVNQMINEALFAVVSKMIGANL